jgi:MOSC domain-containing protein YiiM
MLDTQHQVDLWQACATDVVLELRTGKMERMAGLDIMSGINKKEREGGVFLSSLGLDADEHDPTFHGGVDKAVHGCWYYPIPLHKNAV